MRTPPQRHPSETTLIAYAAGSLGVAHRLVVATHACRCRECRETILAAELVGGLMLDDFEPTALKPDALQSCLAKLDTPEAAARPVVRPDPVASAEWGGAELPRALRSLMPEKLRWLAPGLQHAKLFSDERGTLHVVRVQPDVALPQHTHRGLELTCVLEGAFHDDTGAYLEADVCEGDEVGDSEPNGHDHLVVADPPGACVCIIATSGRMQFKGWVARLLQPLMPF